MVHHGAILEYRVYLKRMLDLFTLIRVAGREFFPSIVVVGMDSSDPSSLRSVITDCNVHPPVPGNPRVPRHLIQFPS